MRRISILAVLPLLVVVGACGDDDDDGGALSAGSFCDRAELVDQRFDELDENFEGSEVPTGETFDQAADAIGALVDGAPDEIRDDLETVADGVRQIAELFGDIDFSDPEALADPENADALAEIGETMEGLGEEIEEASDRVGTYLEDECGISIDDDADTDVTTEDSEE